MMLQVDESFQRKLDAFNGSQGGPSYIAAAWHPRKNRWQIFAVPRNDSAHPLARNEVTAKLMSNFPDDSGRRGVLLFSWCKRDEHARDIGFEPLDDRLFTTLHWADSFRDRHHFEEVIKTPELQREIREKADIRAVAAGAANYWKHIDRVLVSMNTTNKMTADWRHRLAHR